MVQRFSGYRQSAWLTLGSTPFRRARVQNRTHRRRVTGMSHSVIVMKHLTLPEIERRATDSAPTRYHRATRARACSIAASSSTLSPGSLTVAERITLAVPSTSSLSCRSLGRYAIRAVAPSD